MPQSILKRIVASKKKEVARKKKILPLDKLKMRLDKLTSPRDFKTSVFFKQGVSIIAEIKRFSPSAGILRENLNPLHLARVYEENGASAISVLVEGEFFGGSLKDVSDIRKVTFLPVLAKEFIVDEYQLFEARAQGADAVLLIARLLEERELLKLHMIAEDLGMSCIVEVHSPRDVDKILGFRCPIIVGINNRDLENFQVDLVTTGRILNLISPSHFVVSESGIKNSDDIRLLKRRGVSAFLVGESLLRSDDPARKLRELCNG